MRLILLTMAAVLWIFLGAFGCGYHLEQDGLLCQNVSQVFVPVFDNATTYTYAGVTFSNALTQEILAKTSTRPTQAHDAPYRIKARVKKIMFSPMVRDTHETVRQQKITVWTDIELTSARGEILWAVTDMTASKDYILTRNWQSGTMQEEEAEIRSTIQDIAARIAEKTVKAMKNNF